MTNFSGTRRTETTQALHDRGIPVMSGTRDALHAARNILRFRDYTYRPGNAQTHSPINVTGMFNDSRVLQEYDALALLARGGISTVTSYPISNAHDLDLVASQLEYPVVLKTAERGVLHKSDVGGVVLNIRHFDALCDAYQQMSHRLGQSALVQPMMPSDRELILGMKTDDTFGALIIVGAGGILAEYVKDSFTIVPDAPEEEVARKIERLRIYPILKGVRGARAINFDLLVDTILKFSALAQTLAELVQEIDINPLHVSAEHVLALDALIVAKEH